MWIDDSILTYSVFAICVVLFCGRTYRKTKNIFRTVVMFFWIAAIYYVFSSSILPIQLTNSGSHLASYAQMFGIMSFEKLTKYFWGHFMTRVEYFSSYLVLAYFGHLLFSKMRKLKFSSLVLAGLLIIHVGYNVCLNIIVDEVVKDINAEDLYMIVMGFALGWLAGKLTLKLWPGLSDKLAKKCGE